MNCLEARNISKSFRDRIVVNNISVKVNQGEIIGLLGPNGAGKTTTFLMILGIYKPDTGRIFLNQNDITKMPIYIRARQGISFLPQEPSVFKGLTVKENILAIIKVFGLRKALVYVLLIMTLGTFVGWFTGNFIFSWTSFNECLEWNRMTRIQSHKITLSTMVYVPCHLKPAEVSYEKDRSIGYGLTQM